jgi:hypothetical protein
VAEVQVTSRTVIVEPLQLDLSTELHYGPLPAVRWDQVNLTSAVLVPYGFTPPQVGKDWNCYLFLRQVEDGTDGAWDLTGATSLTMTYWSRETRTAATMSATLQSPQSDGKVLLVSQSTASLTAGGYDFSLCADIATNVPAVLCQGTLEILAAVPS